MFPNATLLPSSLLHRCELVTVAGQLPFVIAKL